MTYAEVQDYLFSLRTIGSKFGLERMHRFYETMGLPGHKLPLIHVAGTNGKGSVCAMVEAIARAHGLRTGLFTSPHLLRLGERVQVNRQILGEDQIVAYIEELRPLCEQISGGQIADHPTFFELMTALALLHFERSKCGVAVLETGLGGRLDSTNVVQPVVTAITSIAFDHQEILGNSLEEIAAEKAGIIKPGVPLVLGQLPPQAEAVIVARAKELGAPVLRMCDFFAEAESAAAEGKQPYPQTALSGDFQRRNAAVALLIWREFCRLTGTGCDLPLALRALQDVQWAGRWQQLYFDDGRELILDASHNEEGARALEENLSGYVRERGVAPIIVTGVLGLSRAQALLRVIARYARTICLVEVHQPRASSLAELRAAVPQDFAGKVLVAQVEDVFPGGNVLGELLSGEGGKDVPVIVTGSIYLIGEVLTRLCNEHSLEATLLQDKISS